MDRPRRVHHDMDFKVTRDIEKEKEKDNNLDPFGYNDNDFLNPIEDNIEEEPKKISGGTASWLEDTDKLNLPSRIYNSNNTNNSNNPRSNSGEINYKEKNVFHMRENNLFERNINSSNNLREKLAKETEEKEFKKYISFYFLRKAQENALKQKRKEKRTKMKEKNERMEEIERLNKERENNLMKKILKREQIKEKHDKQRKEKFTMDKNKREEKMKKCLTQKKELMKEQNERRIRNN